MKILVIGSDGFVGRSLVSALKIDHEMYEASRGNSNDKIYQVDLLKPDTISKLLDEIQPEVIVNCSGIVENSDKANQNPIFLRNLLKEIVRRKLKLLKFIYMGSAAEYGIVGATGEPVKEETPLKAGSKYGISKINEVKVADEFREKYELPIIEARLFNPIGLGMSERFIIPRILSQIKDIKNGLRDNIEISRLDAERDYISISDCARAIKSIIEGDPKFIAYNIGSGSSTSNKELLEIIISNYKLDKAPKIIETSTTKEPLFAARADITRLKKDFNWSNEKSIEATIKEIVNASYK